jgi:hypothetical protein
MRERSFGGDVHQVGFSGSVCVKTHIFTIVMAIAVLGIASD